MVMLLIGIAKENYKYNTMVGKVFTRIILVLVSVTLIAQNYNKACTPVCNNQLNVSIDQSGSIEILPAMLLSGSYDCPGPLIVTLFTEDNTLIPGTVLDCQFVGQPVIAMLNDTQTGNSCWATLNIEDKLPPEISCEDITVNCTADLTPVEDGFPTFPDASDNCTSVSFSYSDEIIETDCTEGFLAQVVRTWIGFDAMNFSDTCTQNIFIQQPLLSDVTPPDHFMNIPCGQSTSIDSFPGPTLFGEPLYVNMVCNFVAIPQPDQVLDLCGDTEKIVRNWLVSDMCLNTSTIMTQILETVDTIPPIVTCPDSIEVSTDFINCFATYNNTLTPGVVENCGAYIVTHSSEFGEGDGPFELAPGDHILGFTVTDECGNSASCEYNVSVVDDVSPIPVCNDEIVIALDGNGDGEVCANVLDAGSYDNCAIDSMKIRRMDSCMPGSPGTAFDDCTPIFCCDLDTEVMVILGVWDTSGNYNECMAGVMVQDKIDPEIICPPDLTMECDLYPITVDTGGDIITVPSGELFPPAVQDGINGYAYDNCMIDSISVSLDDNVDTCTKEGFVTRTFIVTDSQGQTDICTQTITFIDTTPPVITFPDSVHIDCAFADDLSVTGQPTATDNCIPFVFTSDDLQLTFEDDVCSYKIIRTWKVYNNCSNEFTSDNQVILVTDFEPPVFGLPPGDVTLENICTGEPLPFEPVGGVTDNCGEPEIDILQDITIDGNCPNNYTVQRIWQATDECGQTATIAQNIAVEDTMFPELLNLPDNLTVNCEDPTDFNNVSASDNCPGNLNVQHNDVTTPGSCPDNFTITRTWSVSDACGLTTTASRTIVFEDNDAPVFSSFPNDLTIDCDATIPAPENLIAIDNCDQDVTVVSVDAIIPSPDCAQESLVLRTYTASDNCGNILERTQAITIMDLTPPVIFGIPNDITLDCADLVPVLPNVSAIDNCDTPGVDVSEDEFPGTCPANRIILRTWIAVDDCGNVSSDTQTITILDTTLPEFSNTPQDMTVSCEDTIPDADPTASDDCSTLSNIVFTEAMNAGNCPNNFTTIRTWTVQDACGNIATWVQTIQTIDTTIPQITNVPQDATISCSDNFPTPDFSDNCTTDLIIDSIDNRVIDNCEHDYTLLRTWVATDECGNSNTATVLITVEDNFAPVIICPEPDSVFTVGAQPYDCTERVVLDPVVTDNCDGNVLVSAALVNFNEDLNVMLDTIIYPEPEGDFSFEYPLGTTEVTFTATDACGLTTTCSTTVFVDEITSPSVICSGLPFDLDNTGFLAFDSTYLVDNNIISDVCSPIDSVHTTPAFFDCDDLFDFDTEEGIDIRIFVCDYWGKHTECITEATVFEGDANCPQSVPLSEFETFALGNIRTEDFRKVENVAVYIEEDMEAMDMSSTNGIYLFQELEMGNNYRIRPYKNDDPTNGVTTYDLVLLKKHILNLAPLNSPYKLIAADVNSSGSITTYDAVLLLRLILNVDTEFTANTSWRFVDRSYNFPDGNPFLEPCPEEIELMDMQQHAYSADFTAVKIGDLNGSVVVNGFSQTAPRSEKAFPVAIENKKATAGESILVSCSANNFEEIAALQFGLGFDIDIVEFQNIENLPNSVLTSLQEENFGTDSAGKGILNFAWTTVDSRKLFPDAELFTMRFLVKQNTPNIAKHFNIAQRAIPAIMYKKDGKPISVFLENTNPASNNNEAVVLYSNVPNPFDKSTLIRFALPEDGQAELTILDSNGRRIRSMLIQGEKGLNEVTILSDIFPASGVYHYILKSEFGTASNKLVMIR